MNYRLHATRITTSHWLTFKGSGHEGVAPLPGLPLAAVISGYSAPVSLTCQPLTALDKPARLTVPLVELYYVYSLIVATNATID